MKKEKQNIVRIGFNDIYWEIEVKKTGKVEFENVDYRDPDPIIELAWGWGAGMTKEEIKEAAGDCPVEYESIKILLSAAISLRDKLNVLIEQG